MRYEVHVIAGLGGWFTSGGTRGIDKLLDDMAPAWDAQHWWHREWERLFNGIMERQAAHRDRPRIALIGHSFGALRCIQVATRLRDRGIPVDYIGGIDTTAGYQQIVPANVRKVDEFWSTSGFFNAPLNARRRDPSGRSGGRFTYPTNWHGEGGKPIIVPGGHIPCASHEITRKTILASIRKVLKP